VTNSLLSHNPQRLLMRLLGSLYSYLAPNASWFYRKSHEPVQGGVPLVTDIKRATTAMGRVEQDAMRLTDDPIYPLIRAVAGELQAVQDAAWGDPYKIHPPMKVHLHHGSCTEYRSVPLIFRRGTADYVIGYCEEVVDTGENHLMSRSWSVNIEEGGWTYIPLFPVHWADWGGINDE
jgi:hypothetical protein